MWLPVYMSVCLCDPVSVCVCVWLSLIRFSTVVGLLNEKAPFYVRGGTDWTRAAAGGQKAGRHCFFQIDIHSLRYAHACIVYLWSMRSTKFRRVLLGLRALIFLAQGPLVSLAHPPSKLPCLFLSSAPRIPPNPHFLPRKYTRTSFFLTSLFLTHIWRNTA